MPWQTVDQAQGWMKQAVCDGAQGSISSLQLMTLGGMVSLQGLPLYFLGEDSTHGENRSYSWHCLLL